MLRGAENQRTKFFTIRCDSAMWNFIRCDCVVKIWRTLQKRYNLNHDFTIKIIRDWPSNDWTTNDWMFDDWMSNPYGVWPHSLLKIKSSLWAFVRILSIPTFKNPKVPKSQSPDFVYPHGFSPCKLLKIHKVPKSRLCVSARIFAMQTFTNQNNSSPAYESSYGVSPYKLFKKSQSPKVQTLCIRADFCLTTF